MLLVCVAKCQVLKWALCSSFKQIKATNHLIRLMYWNKYAEEMGESSSEAISIQSCERLLEDDNLWTDLLSRCQTTISWLWIIVTSARIRASDWMWFKIHYLLCIWIELELAQFPVTARGCWGVRKADPWARQHEGSIDFLLLLQRVVVRGW